MTTHDWEVQETRALLEDASTPEDVLDRLDKWLDERWAIDVIREGSTEARSTLRELGSALFRHPSLPTHLLLKGYLTRDHLRSTLENPNLPFALLVDDAPRDRQILVSRVPIHRLIEANILIDEGLLLAFVAAYGVEQATPNRVRNFRMMRGHLVRKGQNVNFTEAVPLFEGWLDRTSSPWRDGIRLGIDLYTFHRQWMRQQGREPLAFPLDALFRRAIGEEEAPG